MSDGRNRPLAFFALYCRAEAEEDEIDDFIDDWHDLPDGGGQSLPEFLGMTDDEYAVFVTDARTLPLIRTARTTHQPLVTAVRAYVSGLQADGGPNDQPAVMALSSWLDR